jgi:ribosomal protein L3 glutamine methyltransferase
MAHLGGKDGLDLVLKIIDGAPARMTAAGGMVCEIGMGRERLEALRPDLPFLWLDTATSAGELFWLAAGDFPVPRAEAKKAKKPLKG